MERRRQSFAPVKEGDEIEVKIEAVGEKGDGIAKVNGFVLFVPKTKQGENVKIKVTRVLKNVGFAEKIGEGTPSAETSEETTEEPAEEETSEETTEEQTEEEFEDTEDFGEEPKEETSEEETEEEQTEE